MLPTLTLTLDTVLILRPNLIYKSNRKCHPVFHEVNVGKELASLPPSRERQKNMRHYAKAPEYTISFNYIAFIPLFYK